jgi:hypothetical protein
MAAQCFLDQARACNSACMAFREGLGDKCVILAGIDTASRHLGVLSQSIAVAVKSMKNKNARDRANIPPPKVQ